MKAICIICARGGSKGLKNKNLLKIKNKSLIQISFEHAKKSKLFDKIILSTDSNKIINSIKKFKFDKVIKRPKKLSTDRAGKVQAIKHAFQYSESIYNQKFDYIVDLDVTSPLRNILDIRKAFQKIIENNSDNLITICESKKNPYFNMIKIRNNKPIPIFKTKKFKSRQSAPDVFDMNASIYIWKRNSLLEKPLFNKKTTYYKMPIERSIDIDNYLDYKLVKFLYEI